MRQAGRWDWRLGVGAVVMSLATAVRCEIDTDAARAGAGMDVSARKDEEVVSGTSFCA